MTNLKEKLAERIHSLTGFVTHDERRAKIINDKNESLHDLITPIIKDGYARYFFKDGSDFIYVENNNSIEKGKEIGLTYHLDKKTLKLDEWQRVIMLNILYGLKE